MVKDYLIVHKDVLPDYFLKVLEARSLLESAQCSSVSEAVKSVGISRSTYYKYKDTVFKPREDFGRKFTLSLLLSDQSGILSNVLNILYEYQTNIITIHQDIPINHNAIVIITLDSAQMDGNVDDLIKDLKKLNGVRRVRLMTME